MTTFGAAVAAGYNGPAQPAPDTRVIRMDVFEDTTPTLLRRVKDVGGYIDTNDVTDVTLRVFDLSGDTPRTAVHTLPVGVEECLLSTLVVDSAWEIDALGYNFRHKVWLGLIPEGGHIYRFEYTIYVLSEDVTIATREIPLIWELHTAARMGG